MTVLPSTAFQCLTHQCRVENFILSINYANKCIHAYALPGGRSPRRRWGLCMKIQEAPFLSFFLFREHNVNGNNGKKNSCVGVCNKLPHKQPSDIELLKSKYIQVVKT